MGAFGITPRVVFSAHSPARKNTQKIINFKSFRWSLCSLYFCSVLLCGSYRSNHSRGANRHNISLNQSSVLTGCHNFCQKAKIPPTPLIFQSLIPPHFIRDCKHPLLSDSLLRSFISLLQTPNFRLPQKHTATPLRFHFLQGFKAP